jgi:alkylation response protein AidB-like acyl-CoA dehydrogenase
MGLFSLIIPAEYEGLGLSNSGYSRVLQQTSRYDASTSLTIGAHSSIGMKALLLFGNEEQKKRYLPRLATGELSVLSDRGWLRFRRSIGQDERQ